MNNTISISKQHNKSGRSDKLLSSLQADFKLAGTPVLRINNNDFIIQKCPEIETLVAKVTAASKQVNLIVNHLPDVLVKMTINNLLEEELVQTNKIESIDTDRLSVRAILVNKSGSEQFRESQIVYQYKQLLKGNVAFTNPSQLSALYFNFLENYISPDDLDAMGQLFRKDTVYVVTGTGKKVHTGVGGEANIYLAIQTLLDYLSYDDENIYIKVAVFHYLFGYIHPFYDGNGRMVRLITAAKLLPEISISAIALSDIIANHESQYYQMYEETNSRFNVHDLTSFVFQFLEFIYKAIDKTIYHLTYNNNLLDKFHEHVYYLKLTEEDKQILSILYQATLVNQTLTQTSLINFTDFSPESAIQSVARLQSKHIITVILTDDQSVISFDKIWLAANIK